MKGSNVIGFILATVVMSAIGFMRAGSNPSLPPNAPKDAVEYFESQDGKSWVALFPDRLEVESKGPLGGHSSIDLSEVKSIKKWGYKIIVNSTQGQVTFDLTGLSSVTSASRFVKKLKELSKDS